MLRRGTPTGRDGSPSRPLTCSRHKQRVSAIPGVLLHVSPGLIWTSYHMLPCGTLQVPSTVVDCSLKRQAPTIFLSLPGRLGLGDGRGDRVVLHCLWTQIIVRRPGYTPLGYAPAYHARVKNSFAPFCTQIQPVKMARRFFWWPRRHNLDSRGMYGA
jgi:hypothetical protein